MPGSIRCVVFDSLLSLCLIPVCVYSVYKIPPLKQNEGYRAQDWGDLAEPLWKGRLRIIELGQKVNFKFEDATTGASHDRN
jgi:hypothetical protein